MGFFLSQSNMAQLNMPNYKNTPRAFVKSIVWGRFKGMIPHLGNRKTSEALVMSLLLPFLGILSGQTWKYIQKDALFYGEQQGLPTEAAETIKQRFLL